MASHTLEIELDVSKDSLDCIIEMAGYGIGHWANSATQSDAGKSYVIFENAEGEYAEHVLSYDKIIESFWKFANPGSQIKGASSMVRRYALNAVIDGIRNGEGDIDAGHIDSDLADEIMQFACFGEVQYG